MQIMTRFLNSHLRCCTPSSAQSYFSQNAHTHRQTDTHTHTHTHKRTHTYTHTHVHTCTHTYTHTPTHSHIHTHALSHTHTHTHTGYEKPGHSTLVSVKGLVSAAHAQGASRPPKQVSSHIQIQLCVMCFNLKKNVK